MIRIMTADGRGGRTITVDGILSKESVEAVQRCCVEALSKGRPVSLHLRDVSAIDECGRTILRHLAAVGVALTAKGAKPVA